MDMKKFNDSIIEEFRANNGKVAMFADYPMVILHTVGARSGNLLLVPLVLTVEDDGEMILFGSYAGSQKNPAWVYNLRANPQIDVELSSGVHKSRVVEFSADSARARVQQQAEVSAQFAEYVTKAAPRDSPVFRIELL